MAVNILSALDSGTTGQIIEIECKISKGLPNIVIVGFASKATDEAKERIRAAFSSSNLELPRKRIIINLAPADIPKEGTSFDLGIAAAIMSASGQVKHSVTSKEMFLGELGLNGRVRSIRGVIGKILAGKSRGIKTFWIPLSNVLQAQLIPDIELIPVANLSEFYGLLAGQIPVKPVATNGGKVPSDVTIKIYDDINQVVGQTIAKRALEVAAAGNHNILLNGPPGTGKSMLAKTLPSLLPPLTKNEIVEVTHLHSLADNNYDEIVAHRPFRSPHHSSSDVSIIGGGNNPRPGEISLSHQGILFLDELPEFKRSAIEALRQPLEERKITVGRAKGTATFPANFILVATANPCPCGNFGTSRECSCMPAAISKYQRKLSGPILDRIDLYVTVDDVKHDKLLKDNKGVDTSVVVSKRVKEAQERQNDRQNKLNSSLSNSQLKKIVKLTDAAETLLNQAAEKLGISARGYMKTVKVARTIADLEKSDTVEAEHVSEALQYRHRPAYL